MVSAASRQPIADNARRRIRCEGWRRLRRPPIGKDRSLHIARQASHCSPAWQCPSPSSLARRAAQTCAARRRAPHESRLGQWSIAFEVDPGECCESRHRPVRGQRLHQRSPVEDANDEPIPNFHGPPAPKRAGSCLCQRLTGRQEWFPVAISGIPSPARRI